MSGALKKKIQKKFKIRGYGLRVDALDDIVSFLNRFPGVEDDALDLLLDRIQFHSQKLAVKSSIIGKDTTGRVIRELLEADDAVEESTSSIASALRVVDAFLIPKFRYDPIKKIFHQHNGPLPIHGDASAKAALYKDRFLLLSQRLSRDERFSRPAFDTEMSRSGSCQIVPIQSLVGQIGERWVMGLISQLEDGHFYLEDLTASVEIDLSKAKIATGLLSENTIVVAEGEMLPNGTFQVITCGFPPLEERDKSRKILGQRDFFGDGALEKDEMLRLAALEKNAINDMFVILSDIWVDDEEVMGKLKTVLSGFEGQEVVPSLFVFMGNFCSRPCNLSFNSFATLRLMFGKLGQLIESHPRIKDHSRFLFIPGPDDVGPSTALPRCSFPNYLTDELRKHIPNAIFSSNPCRVTFYTQEIVFFRHDLLYRMRRSCLMPPSLEETDNVFEHVSFDFPQIFVFFWMWILTDSTGFCSDLTSFEFLLQLVATITQQSHLCPLPLVIQPIIWNYDHSLHLYPLPHTIVLGDKSEQKAFKYNGITCFNPGSFANDSTFVAYRPCTQEVELSAL